MKINNSLKFFLIVLLIFITYNYIEIFNKRPQSIHHWRQTDCASIALNYYQNGMNFLEPEVHHQSSDNLTSGYGVGEFPILYYFIAVNYKIFGYSDILYRIINFILFIIGLFYLFKLTYSFLRDFFWSFFIVSILISSPVIVYYANSFISDTTALSFTLIGWYHFFKFYKTNIRLSLYYSLIILTLASLLKITAGISLIVIFSLYVFNLIKARTFKKTSIIHILFFILSFAFIALWYLYAISYNKLHGTQYFSTRTWPIWELPSTEIDTIINNIKNMWGYEYFNLPTYILLVISLIFILVFVTKNKFIFNFITLLIFIGTICYSLLWFFAFKEHDYYIINILILPIFIVLTATDNLKNNFPNIFNSTILKTIIIIFISYNIYSNIKSINNRYYGWVNEYPKYQFIHNISDYLDEIGIEKNDKVICTPDISHNYTLYLMNRKGWTDLYGITSSKEGIELGIKKGAKYLLLIDENEVIANKPFISSFTYHKVGEYGNVTIYKLDGIQNNSFENNRKIIREININLENIDSISKKIKSTCNNIIAEGYSTLCNNKYHSKSNSVKINSNAPFSLTHKIRVKAGEVYEFSAYKLGNIEANLVVSDTKNKGIYLSQNKSNLVDSVGWQKLIIKYMIPDILNNDSLVIYVYNPADTDCYFDDLSIKQLN